MRDAYFAGLGVVAGLCFLALAISCPEDEEVTIGSAVDGWFPDIVPMEYDGTPPPPPLTGEELLCAFHNTIPYQMVTCIDHGKRKTECIFDRKRRACITFLDDTTPTDTAP